MSDTRVERVSVPSPEDASDRTAKHNVRQRVKEVVDPPQEVRIEEIKKEETRDDKSITAFSKKDS